MNTTYTGLIEIGDPPRYWDGYSLKGTTHNPNEAIWFQREQDALMIVDRLLHDYEWKVVEHGFDHA